MIVLEHKKNTICRPCSKIINIYIKSPRRAATRSGQTSASEIRYKPHCIFYFSIK
nr:MAG TPA: hypothetical protein [Caudoviricetes sp.]